VFAGLTSFGSPDVRVEVNGDVDPGMEHGHRMRCVAGCGE
jgi:hypothetical protein